MVEIHLDGAVGDLTHRALDHLPGLVEHRDGAADHEELLADLAVDGESRLREVDHIGGIIFAVAVFGAQDEIKRIARLFVLQGGFKLGKEHAGAVDVLQGSAGGGFVRDLSFYFEGVAHSYDFVILYFHIAKLVLFGEFTR